MSPSEGSPRRSAVDGGPEGPGAPRFVDLTSAFAAFSDHWRPRVAARLNGQDVRLVKVQGVFPWHRQDPSAPLRPRALARRAHPSSY